MTISRIVSDNNCKCPRNQILVGSLTSYVSSPLVFLDPSQLWGRQPVSLCHCHVGEIIIFICIFYIEEKTFIHQTPWRNPETSGSNWRAAQMTDLTRRLVGRNKKIQEILIMPNLRHFPPRPRTRRTPCSRCWTPWPGSTS